MTPRRMAHLAHWRRRREIVGIVGVHRIEHWVVEQQSRYKFEDMLADALGRHSGALDVFGSLANVNTWLLTGGLISVAPSYTSAVAMVANFITDLGPGLSINGLAMPPVPLADRVSALSSN